MTHKYDTLRLKYRNYGKPWTDELDYLLEKLFSEGKTIEELMLYFGRNEGSVRARLEKLELINRWDNLPKYDPHTLSEKELELNRDINKLQAEIDRNYSKINEKQKNLMKVVEKRTARGLEYITIDKLLQIAIQDMIDNGWYTNTESALLSLLNRI